MSEHYFDELARRVATTRTRREALRILGTGLFAGLSLAFGAGLFGTKKAGAQSSCLPVDEYGGCPVGEKTARPGFTPEPNGCGGGITQHIVPDSFFDADFRPACDAHDRCYADCGKTKRECDEKFFFDLLDACRAAYPSAWQVVAYAACEAAADGYYLGVRTLGYAYWVAAQRSACECCIS